MTDREIVLTIFMLMAVTAGLFCYGLWGRYVANSVVLGEAEARALVREELLAMPCVHAQAEEAGYTGLNRRDIGAMVDACASEPVQSEWLAGRPACERDQYVRITRVRSVVLDDVLMASRLCSVDPVRLEQQRALTRSEG